MDQDVRSVLNHVHDRLADRWEIADMPVRDMSQRSQQHWMAVLHATLRELGVDEAPEARHIFLAVLFDQSVESSLDLSFIDVWALSKCKNVLRDRLTQLARSIQ